MLKRKPKKPQRPALPKEGVGRRLGEALARAGEGAASRLAERCDVTVQAIGGWIKTGRFGVEHLPAIARQLDISLDWLFMGAAPQVAAVTTQPSPWDMLGEPRDNEVELVGLYRGLPDEEKTRVWDVIDLHLRRTVQAYDRAAGPRRIDLQKSAEQRLIVAQIIAQSKDG